MSASDWAPEPSIAEQRPLAPGMSTNTWAIWVMALLPLLGAVFTLAQNPAAQLQSAISRSEQQLQAAQSGSFATPTTAFNSGTLISLGLSLVLTAIQVLLALTDQQTLAARGVIRPLPWGWAFLNPVYIIGRHVVVRRRVHGSLAPLWAWIVVEALAIVITVSVFVAAISSALASASMP